MADAGFLEPIGDAEFETDGDQLSPDGTADAAASDEGAAGEGQEEQATGEQVEPEPQPQPAMVSEEVAKAREEAAYWRAQAQAVQQPAKQPQMTDEERKALEDDFLADPYGTMQKTAAGIARNMIVEQSKLRMMDEYEDYPEVIKKFQDMAKTNPTLEAHLDNHYDPARFAYNYVKKQEALKDIEDPEKYRERVRKEERERAKKEYALEVAGETPTTPAKAKGSGGSAPADPTGGDLDPFKDNGLD